MSQLTTILYEIKDGVAHIILNRPERLNALGKVALDELNTAMDQAESDSAVRVIVLSGAGRSFSSGFDLKEQMELQPEGPRMRAATTTITALQRRPPAPPP